MDQGNQNIARLALSFKKLYTLFHVREGEMHSNAITMISSFFLRRVVKNAMQNEDMRLRNLVNEMGSGKWTAVAKALGRRSKRVSTGLNRN